MHLVLQCIIYLIVGIALDVLITLQYRAVIARQRLRASLLSMSITALGFLAVELIISKLWVLLGFYVLGTGIGTFIGMSVNSQLKKKKTG